MQQVVNKADELLAALDRGESLPSSWYTDPQMTEAEIHKLFRKTWQYVGPTQKLKNVGDYITGYVGEIPVVIVRNEKGLEGFINVCRHRRHEVMKGCGNSKILQCRYHAWTYDLCGELKAAPRSDREENFSTADYPLLPIKVETLGPWVFANADAECKPLATYFGPVLEIIAGSGIELDKLELWSRDEWEARANWKTMLENYLECYHCPVAHPGFSAAIDVDQDSYKLEEHQWFSTQIGYVRQSALEGDTKVKIYDAKGAVKQAQYFLLYPNLTININPGFPNLSVDFWMPDGPNRAKGFSEQYFAPGVDKKWAEELIQFNAEVGDEDDVLTNSVQLGLLGGEPSVGRFLTNSEHLCIHFLKYIVRAMCD
ncbi:MAG: aromatic ring-hydroxylating dioxygenase subunit alpha [Cyanobacteria bacterium PR.3.49]|nr:aromatic ring-hydroxylating dioxygenase subunit alpha [Cyanobacteria bacterium PR.3.49]